MKTSPIYAVNRRQFSVATISLAAASVWSSRAIGALYRPKFSDNPFQLGVASGDPSTDGFVIWSRLGPKPLEGGGMPDEPVEVRWEVASDEQFQTVLKKGVTVATPDWAHSVHVEVTGLEADRWYFYRFQCAGEVSPTGRSRTLPNAESEIDSLRFAFASCQHFEAGYYTAYEHMADESLDFVVHLGDYIYEGSGEVERKNRVRRHLGPEIESLADYRNRHALYKSDQALQTVHARFPWLVTWDDHEVDNNYANDISEKVGVKAVDFLGRRARAYQAYYEHMPLRRSSLPQGPLMQLYRGISFGQLANFLVLDTRQYRTDQPCGDKRAASCDATRDPKATMLGDRQERWLLNGLTASACRWNVLAQQVMMAPVDREAGSEAKFSMDQWSGYEANRERLLRFVDERKTNNLVVLTGDIHSNWANDLFHGSKAVATEFVGTSISSGGDGRIGPLTLDTLLSENPFVKFHNTERGYVRCTLSPESWQTDYQVVPYVTRPGAPLITRASFVTENSRPGAQHA